MTIRQRVDEFLVNHGMVVVRFILNPILFLTIMVSLWTPVLLWLNGTHSLFTAMFLSQLGHIPRAVIEHCILYCYDVYYGESEGVEMNTE
jgi:hypothetical protein